MAQKLNKETYDIERFPNGQPTFEATQAGPSVEWLNWVAVAFLVGAVAIACGFAYRTGYDHGYQEAWAIEAATDIR
jgi:hypothetical protein